MSKLTLIEGGAFKDHRGSLGFCNDFDLTPIKRFYSLEHADISVIRAWQGHKIEHKWFSVVKGSFLIATVIPDDWSHPNPNLPVKSFTLEASMPSVLYVPAGYANGIRALVNDSIILVFSNLDLKDAKDDMYRFDSQLWFDFKQVK